MKRLLALTIWFACAAVLCAAPLKINGPTQVDVYKIVDLAPDGVGTEDVVFWDIAEEAQADIRERGQNLSFTGPPGAYHIKVHVIPVKDGKIIGPASTQRVVVTIGGTPPGPGPGPGPADPLTKSLQAGYDLDTDADKTTSLALLRAVYAGLPPLVPTSGVTNNATAAAWLKRVIENPNGGLPPAKVANLRRAIAADLVSALGTDPTASVDLVKFAAELTKIGQALQGVR